MTAEPILTLYRFKNQYKARLARLHREQLILHALLQNLPTQSVRAIADSEVAAIYKNLYWDRISGDNLPAGVDFAVFDFAVNSGVSRAAKMLQSVVGVTQDGVIGPATIEATKTYVAMSITNRRLAFMQSLSIWSTFGKGWAARIADVKNQIKALCG